MKILKNVQYFVLFAMIGALGLSSCQKEDVGLEELKEENMEVSSTNRLKALEPLQVGDLYGGGIVGFIESTNQKLIVAKSDLGTAQWHPNNLNVFYNSGLDNEIHGGYYITEKIVNAGGQGSYAAKLCWEYSYDGFDDWYLPCKYELKELRKNKELIGAYQETTYWNSSQIDHWVANLLNFYEADIKEYGYKTEYHRVRPVRYIGWGYRYSPDFVEPKVTLTNSSSAKFSSGVTSNQSAGSYSIIERGYCIGTSPNPTEQTRYNSGEGLIYGSLTNLAPFTKYYIRPYAIAYSSDKIFYGPEIIYENIFSVVIAGGPTQATINVSIDENEPGISEFGYLVSTSATLDINNSQKTVKSTSPFTYYLSAPKGARRYTRAYVIVDGVVSYGPVYCVYNSSGYYNTIYPM